MATSASSGEEAYEDYASAIYYQSQERISPPSPMVADREVFSDQTITEARENTTEEEGEWYTIPKKVRSSQRKPKRARISTINDSPVKQQGLTIIIEGIESNVVKINPIKRAKFLNENVGQVQKIERGRNDLKIMCKNQQQAEKLRSMTEFAGIAIKADWYDPDKKKRKGVIKVSTDIEDEELLEVLKKDKVIGVKRFKKRIDGELQNTPSVLLTFERREVPKELYFAYERYEVFDYVPPPPRCFKCQMFGHVADSCKNKVRCVRCGEGHSYDDCPNKETRKCCRCKQNHSAAYLGCTSYKEAVKINSIKQNEKISYAEATKKFHTVKAEPISAQAQATVQAPSQKEERNTPSQRRTGKPKPQRISHKSKNGNASPFIFGKDQTSTPMAFRD
ncbi:uncharacterized protein LOC121425900 [Lytechinus variegatus]|uniref:uncharacterized protein LOC121425900 n=1 Tax=Lytechinus variegatus TaxID=7654 RepID=UPI001BB181F5|nr:uncharacterized protein LOC121425900 [Lytechinus variegatus]